MMDDDLELKDKLDTAIWIGKALFDRGKVTGSTSNLSFRHNERMYITGGGSCFGRLTYGSFVCVAPDGTPVVGIPSKEFPLHLALYQQNDAIGAVLHTHSLYSTLWSCQKDVAERANCLFWYTPYLSMLSDGLVTIPYAPPGSKELFGLFEAQAGAKKVYLLQNHGPITAGKSLLEAFYLMEELETSAKIGWLMRNEPDAVLYQQRTPQGVGLPHRSPK